MAEPLPPGDGFVSWLDMGGCICGFGKLTQPMANRNKHFGDSVWKVEKISKFKVGIFNQPLWRFASKQDFFDWLKCFEMLVSQKNHFGVDV